METNKPAVIFRRVGGRVIPIRVKDGVSKNHSVDLQGAGKGLALGAAGVGVSASAGKLYKAILGSSTRTSSRAWKTAESISRRFASGAGSQITFDQLIRKQKAQGLVDQALSRASKLSATAPWVRRGALAAGSALIGVGASKITESLVGRKLSDSESWSIGGSVAGASFAAGILGRKGLVKVAKQAVPVARELIRTKMKFMR
jgi:F0F1-type ATP synthase membrane subunit c/vacuolar-type H+-ATPase subunit K